MSHDDNNNKTMPVVKPMSYADAVLNISAGSSSNKSYADAVLNISTGSSSNNYNNIINGDDDNNKKKTKTTPTNPMMMMGVAQKSNVEDDLTCPITLQLPFDPVMAEDGRIYERSAIEKCIKIKQGMELKSPFTHKKMGSKLLPSPQIKNTIETLINTSVIAGDLSNNWMEKHEQKKKMDRLMKKAKNGNEFSMYLVGFNYEQGIDGFPQDYEKAYEWFEKAHNVGSKHATLHLGLLLLEGLGVEKNQQAGLTFVTMAAANGSDAAAWILGSAFADGTYGLGVWKKEAIKWLEVAVSNNCSAKQMKAGTKEQAKKLLDELVESQP